MSEHYILNDVGEPVKADLMTWARWLETGNCVIAKTDVDGIEVSTVFLGLDHNFGRKGPPLIYETMIFGGPHDSYQDRYSTKVEALVGHAKAERIARGEEQP